jgi:hypothetical protein
MVVRGTEYREEESIEVYGEELTVILRPLVDDEFLPIAAFLSEHLDLEAEAEGAVSESIDKLEEDEDIDMERLDEEFVAAMQEAAKLGLAGAYDEEGEEVAHDREEADFIVENMMGGTSVELGGRVLEISGDVRDAEKFRGGRGRVADSRDS